MFSRLKKNKDSRLEAHLPLNVDGSDASCFPLHLLHPLLSQVEVSLQVVAGQRQPQRARGHDDPQAHAVEGRAGNAAGARRPWLALALAKPRLREDLTAALTG